MPSEQDNSIRWQPGPWQFSLRTVFAGVFVVAAAMWCAHLAVVRVEFGSRTSQIALGMTKQQIRSQMGEPQNVVNDREWNYARAEVLSGARVQFDQSGRVEMAEIVSIHPSLEIIAYPVLLLGVIVFCISANVDQASEPPDGSRQTTKVLTPVRLILAIGLFAVVAIVMTTVFWIVLAIS